MQHRIKFNSTPRFDLNGCEIDVWCFEGCLEEIDRFFGITTGEEEEEQATRRKKLVHILKLVYSRKFTRDICEKECVSKKHCVWSLKLFKSGQNTRIFCKITSIGFRVEITFLHLIEKKKSQELTKSDKERIKIISAYEFYES